jgi:signal transduction histidine kinase
MFSFRSLRASPVVGGFAAVAFVSISVLAVLSWQLIELDQQLDAPRRRGIVEAAADQASSHMLDEINGLTSLVAGKTGGGAPPGISMLQLRADGTALMPSAPLPFVPTRPMLPEASPAIFTRATSAELTGTASEAVSLYRRLVTHDDPATRVGALARLAPLLLKLGDHQGALRTYEQLASIDDIGMGGLPTGLVATLGRIAALERLGDARSRLAAIKALNTDLQRGRWLLLQPEYEFYTSEVERQLGSPTGDPDALARADGALWLWHQRHTIGMDGRRLISLSRGPALVIWRQRNDGIAAAIGGPSFLEHLVRSAVPPSFDARLRDLEGRYATGSEGGGELATRVASPVGVPWTLEIRANANSVGPDSVMRRRLVLLVLTTTVLMLGAGWYFTARAISRERETARLQNAFVASVSHEFRSPLTSIAHVAELLSHDRLTERHRRQAYDVLVSDARRLRDLVDNLLEFGRLDAGVIGLHRERVDAGAFVAELVEDARRLSAADGYTIEFMRPEEPALVELDRTAVARAFLNLIDNAIKYSPDCKTVWVDVRRENDSVSIAVRDQGIGIPREDQQHVFRRFVRGSASETRQIRGTGIGLALVREIADAHGASVRLTSAPGQGSRFELVFPAIGDAA